MIAVLTNYAQSRAVADRGVLTKEHQQIRETMCSNSKIGLWLLPPYVLQICSVKAHNRKARSEGGIESRGADDHVKKVLYAVFRATSILRKFCDSLVNDLNIVFGQTLSGSVRIVGLDMYELGGQFTSEYPASGLTLRHPTPNDGKSFSQMFSLSRFSFISSVTCALTWFCNTESRSNQPRSSVSTGTKSVNPQDT